MFEIKYDKWLQILMIVAFLFFGFFFVTAIGNVYWGWEIIPNNTVGTIVGFGFFVALDLASVLGVCVWKIDVNGEEIIYRNYFGIKKKYNFKELEVYVNKKDKIYAYKNKKKVFTIDNNLPAGVHFMVRACEYGVCTMEE